MGWHRMSVGYIGTSNLRMQDAGGALDSWAPAATQGEQPQALDQALEADLTSRRLGNRHSFRTD
jgi:hypothetical protein